jgi:Na+/H+-dicarboxylate symporter
MLFPLWLRNKIWHTVLCVIFILVLSLMPQEKLPKALFSWQDLVVHFIMYGSLAFCIALSLFDKIIETPMSKLGIVPILLGLFGIQVEVLQKILPVNRFFSWEDAACNFLGAFSFYAFIARVKSEN